MEDFASVARADGDARVARVTKIARDAVKRPADDSQACGHEHSCVMCDEWGGITAPIYIAPLQGSSQYTQSQSQSQNWREVFGDPPDMKTDYQGTTLCSPNQKCSEYQSSVPPFRVPGVVQEAQPLDG